MKAHFKILVIVTLIIAACARKIGFVTATPYFDNEPEKFNKEIYIHVENVGKVVDMKGDWFMTARLMAYDSSFKDILRKTFQASFKEVIFTDKVSQKGLSLQVTKLYPYWILTGNKIEHMGGNTIVNPLYTSSFEIDAKLFYNGQELNELHTKSVSTFTTTSSTGTTFRRDFKRSFAEGLVVASRDIYNSTVTKDLSSKLGTQ